MAEIRINATGGVKLYDADDSHYAQIVAGTITSNVDAITLGHNIATFNAAITAGGVLKTDDATEATSTTDGSLQTDGGLSVVKDAVFGDDVKLLSDSSVVAFGADGDTTLTHTDGTGLTLNSTNKLTFGDAASYINQSSDGVLTIAGEATIDLTASTAVLVSNDLKLDSDSSVLGFGADNDTTLTHTDGTGLTLNSTNKLCFNDSSQYIQGASNAILDIAATDEIELNATLVDINANVEISGTATTTGVHTFSATPVFPDGSIAVADLDIDGGTDIGAAIVDADLFIVDDGAGGTNRKVTASRIKTYAASGEGAIETWIQFDGTGTVSIYDSANVSSLTDNGTGDYTITYSNNLANANYGFSVTGTYGGADDTIERIWVVSPYSSSTVAETRSTSIIRVASGINFQPNLHSAVFYDAEIVSVSCFTG